MGQRPVSLEDPFDLPAQAVPLQHVAGGKLLLRVGGEHDDATSEAQSFRPLPFALLSHLAAKALVRDHDLVGGVVRRADPPWDGRPGLRCAAGWPDTGRIKMPQDFHKRQQLEWPSIGYLPHQRHGIRANHRVSGKAYRSVVRHPRRDRPHSHSRVHKWRYGGLGEPAARDRTVFAPDDCGAGEFTLARDFRQAKLARRAPKSVPRVHQCESPGCDSGTWLAGSAR